MISPDPVILIHGLGRSPRAMRLLARTLVNQGFSVHNLGYPSRKHPVETISRQFLAPLISQIQDKIQSPIHFVTHSLGGIVLRHYLQCQNMPPGSRVVMLAPPNQGSPIADRFRHHLWYRQATGPAGQQLTHDPAGFLARLKPLELELGIIAGNRSLDPWFHPCFREAHDGKVAVADTQLPEMTDFLVLPYAHPLIMRAPEVQAQTACFLHRGHFKGSIWHS